MLRLGPFPLLSVLATAIPIVTAWLAPTAASVAQTQRANRTRNEAAAGWTEFTLPRDGHRLHVSSSKGSDANDGLSEARPKKTLQAALAGLRSGKGDWLLLKKGDVWELDGSAPAFDWRISGASPEAPALLGSYGPAGAPRPRIRTKGNHGFQVQGGRGAPPTLQFVAIVGVAFDAGPRDPAKQNPNGVQLRLPTKGLLVEDCEFFGFCNGLAIQERGGRITDVRLRRNVVHECYAGDETHAQGIYCRSIDGLLIEENVIDHGGWSEKVADASPPDIFKHDIYVQADCTDVIVRGNIIANAASHGVQVRTGGICNDNLFVRNAIAVLMGGGTATEKPSEVIGNVILEGRDITKELPRGQGIHLENIPTGVRVAGNILAQQASGARPRAFSILPLQLKGEKTWLGVKDVVIEENIVWDWGGVGLELLDFARGDVDVDGLVLRRNDFTNRIDASPFVVHYCSTTAPKTRFEANRFFSEKAPDSEWMRIGRSACGLDAYLKQLQASSSKAEKPLYAAPEKTLGDYNAVLGGAPSTEAFLAEALKQSRDQWREGYTARAAIAWFKKNFERK